VVRRNKVRKPGLKGSKKTRRTEVHTSSWSQTTKKKGMRGEKRSNLQFNARLTGSGGRKKKKGKRTDRCRKKVTGKI